MSDVKLTDIWAALTVAPIGTLRVVQRDRTDWAKDAGPAIDYPFHGVGGCIERLRVGPAKTGEHRDALVWWDVFLDGELVGELQNLGFTYILEVQIAAVHFPW